MSSTRAGQTRSASKARGGSPNKVGRPPKEDKDSAKKGKRNEEAIHHSKSAGKGQIEEKASKQQQRSTSAHGLRHVHESADEPMSEKKESKVGRPKKVEQAERSTEKDPEGGSPSKRQSKAMTKEKHQHS